MKKVIWVVLLGLVMMGCTTTQKGTGIGAAGGAALGAIIGHQSGNADKGAIAGGLLGGAGGYYAGEKMKKKFCPVDGAHFDASVGFCPTHGVELKYRTAE